MAHVRKDSRKNTLSYEQVLRFCERLKGAVDTIDGQRQQVSPRMHIDATTQAQARAKDMVTTHFSQCGLMLNNYKNVLLQQQQIAKQGSFTVRFQGFTKDVHIFENEKAFKNDLEFLIYMQQQLSKLEVALQQIAKLILQCVELFPPEKLASYDSFADWSEDCQNTRDEHFMRRSNHPNRHHATNFIQQPQRRPQPQLQPQPLPAARQQDQSLFWAKPPQITQKHIPGSSSPHAFAVNRKRALSSNNLWRSRTDKEKALGKKEVQPMEKSQGKIMVSSSTPPRRTKQGDH